MLSFGKNKWSADRSFLPEDYLEKRAERRTNLFSLTLFSVVMVGVVGAFLVTNREWTDVQRYQEAINVRYAQAAQEIDQLKQLEDQKKQLMAKAELTTALIERVPRSILLAEIINRMPPEMTLMEFELKSKRIASMPAAVTRAVKSPTSMTRSNPNAARTMSAPAATAPEYHTRVTIEGITINHNSVARFGAALQDNPLLGNVELIYSEIAIVSAHEVNKFRIEADVLRDADARRLEGLTKPRINGFTDLEGPGNAASNDGGDASGGASDDPMDRTVVKPIIRVRNRNPRTGSDGNRRN